MSSATIELATGLIMNASEAATQTLAPISAKGGGKSYLAGKFVEGLYDAGAPFVVIDPIGNWSALTLGKDGKSPGLSVAVIGGERGDIPLDEDTAEAVGELLIAQSMSVVLDLSELSKTRRKVYVAGFCEALYRTARKHRSPFMVVFEEAQLFAPQHCQKGEERMLGAVTDIVRLGRNYGLGSMLVTQRPQSVSKEVLNQVECLFVGQLRGPQERKAIAGWVSEQGLDRIIDLKELPSLAPGEFYCWSPSWLRTFRKVKILPKRTFDGSSTPVLGKALERQGKRATEGIDGWVEALWRLSREPEGTEAARPLEATGTALSADELEELARLRQDGAEMQKQLRAADERQAELRGRLESGARVLSVLTEAITTVKRAVDQLELAVDYTRREFEGGLPSIEPADELAEQERPPVVLARFIPERRPIAELKGFLAPKASARTQVLPNGLDKSDRVLLTVLAWQKTPIDRARLALLGGYSAKGGGFNNALSRLRTSGRVEGSGELAITASGRKAIGSVPAPPTGPALFEWWLGHPKVDTCMGASLKALRAAGSALSKDQLAERAGYKANTGGFNNALSRLRTLGLVYGKGREPLQLAVDLRAGRG